MRPLKILGGNSDDEKDIVGATRLECVSEHLANKGQET